MSSDENTTQRPTFHEPFPIFSVTDLPRAQNFYCDLLGFTPGYRWPEEGDAQFVVLSLDGSDIGLSAQAEAGNVLGEFMMERRSRGFELCLRVDDIHAAAAYLREQGVVEVEAPNLKPWGEYLAYFADPDGNPIHLYAPPPPVPDTQPD